MGRRAGLGVRKAALGAARGEVEPRRKRGMIAGCDCPDPAGVSPTRIGFLAPAPCRRLSASSVIPAGALSRSSDAQKNGLWSVRPSSPRLLRSQGAPGSRPSVRRHADRRGAGAAPGRGPKLWRGEARASRLPGRQFPLHQAIRAQVASPAHVARIHPTAL